MAQTTLEACCNIFNQQGGTIHGIKEKFEKLSESERDSFCSKLIDVDVTDPRTKLWFFTRRNELLGIVSHLPLID